jgi:hypothetical protein
MGARLGSRIKLSMLMFFVLVMGQSRGWADSITTFVVTIGVVRCAFQALVFVAHPEG